MLAASEPIYIVFTVDGGYAMPLATAICSIATNAASDATIVFHVLYHAFSRPLREKVAASLSAVGRSGVSIAWQEASIDRLNQLPIFNKNLNSLTYLRLLIPQLLPSTVKKAIYLDADVVVVADIGLLWAEPVEGFALLAVRDRIGNIGSPFGLQNYRELGISASAKYFNAGVLVFNNTIWREENLTARLIKYILDHPDSVLREDQDALNAILYNNWREIDFSWNWQVVPELRRAVDQGCWGLELSSKSIVHFVTSAKPWMPGSRYAEKPLFYHYLDMTLWRGWRVPMLLECKVLAIRTIKSVSGILKLLRNNLQTEPTAGADS